MNGEEDALERAAAVRRLHRVRKVFAVTVGLPGVLGLLSGLLAVPTAMLTGHLDRHGGGYLLLGGLLYAVLGAGLCWLAVGAWPHPLFRRGDACPACARGRP